MPDDAPRLDRNPPQFEKAMKLVRERKTTEQLRQGITGQGVRYVLVISLLGSLVALAAVYLYFSP
jgi:hypothetical protein